MRVIVVVPTYNPGPSWSLWIGSFLAQRFKALKLLIIDSSSDDGSVENTCASNIQLVRIKKKEFNHGATRQLAVQLIESEADIVVFLTQDAILASQDSLERLVSTFHDNEVSAAFGRQLPRSGAHPIEAHARIYNYPRQSITKCLADRSKLGLKAIFISNSFAAYRIKDLMSVGGFPENTLFGEDTIVAAKLLLAGKKIRYQGDACVFHSHNYTYIEEFKRYFDIGAMHAHENALLQEFGAPTGEGVRFVKSEVQFLIRHAWQLIPSAVLRALCKYSGYRLGKSHVSMPLRLRRALSMHPSFWQKE